MQRNLRGWYEQVLGEFGNMLAKSNERVKYEIEVKNSVWGIDAVLEQAETCF